MTGAAASTGSRSIVRTVTGANLQQLIGSAANAPIQIQQGPVTVQVGLGAFIPREALAGTGINSIEIGTRFPEQSLGSGVVFQSAAAGTVLNLMDRHSDTPALAPVVLALASAGFTFKAGVSYVLSLTGTTLSVRGSDGSSGSSQPTLSGPPDPQHAFVGALVYSASATSVRLYPKLATHVPGSSCRHGGRPAGLNLQRPSHLRRGEQPVRRRRCNRDGACLACQHRQPEANRRLQSAVGGHLFRQLHRRGERSHRLVGAGIPRRFTGATHGRVLQRHDDARCRDERRSLLSARDHRQLALRLFQHRRGHERHRFRQREERLSLPSAVINSSPDDQTSKAFAPSKLVMGLVRQAQMGTVLKYVFVPEDDSVVIGGRRYMLSMIKLGDLNLDPMRFPTRRCSGHRSSTGSSPTGTTPTSMLGTRARPSTTG